MPNPNLNLKIGEGVGVVYRRSGMWVVHDGVLTSAIPNGNKPPSTVTIIHYLVNQSNGKLVRQNLTLHNVKQVLRTPSNPIFALKCPPTTNPNLHVGTPVVVKIRVKKSISLPTGLDAKNGVLVCSLQNRLHPSGNVWINHWKLITPTSPRVFLTTTRYVNALFVRQVTV